MMLLAACGALTVVLVGTLSWPLWRAVVGRMATRAAYDLGVYRSQLGDLDRDLERGVIEPDEAHVLRLEIERRILKVDAGAENATPDQPKRHTLALAVTIAVLVLVPVGMYGLLGSPRLPDQPFAARAGQIAKLEAQRDKIQDMVKQLADKLQKNPNDGPGWAMLGRSLRILHQPDQAKIALQNAMKLLPDQVQPRLDYAALMIADLPPGSPMPDEFVALMRQILALDAHVPQALYFVGLAESRNGHNDKARELWTDLLQQMPADSEDRAELQQQIDALK